MRTLVNMLRPVDKEIADDAMEAAERVMNAAEPAAPLLMLQHARSTLAAVIRRQANTRLRPAA